MSHCATCRHPQRATIDHQLVHGTPIRTIVASFPNLSIGGLHRHKQCIRKLLQETIQRTDDEQEEHGGDLLRRVHRLADEAEAILEAAKNSQNVKGATSAVCALVRVLELVGRLDGSLAQPHAPGLHLHMNKTTINVSTHDDDTEIAILIAEATHDYDPREIARLKAIAEGQKALPACTELATPR